MRLFERTLGCQTQLYAWAALLHQTNCVPVVSQYCRRGTMLLHQDMHDSRKPNRVPIPFTATEHKALATEVLTKHSHRKEKEK